MNPLYEADIYEVLAESGIGTPKYYCFQTKNELENISKNFTCDQELILKCIASNLIHKSDIGAVQKVSLNTHDIWDCAQTMQSKLSPKQEFQYFLLIEKMNFQTMPSLCFEALVSIKNDDCCGSIITLAPGGIHTNQVNQDNPKNVLIFPTSVYTPAEALEESLSKQPIRNWTGNYRQGKSHIEKKSLEVFFQSLFKLASMLKKKDIHFIEVNPFVVTDKGVVALDGHGVKIEPSPFLGTIKKHNDLNALFTPQKIGIIGVSQNKNSIGRIILENLKESQVPNDNLLIIKPNTNTIEGIKCVPDIGALKDNPVDLLIVTTPAVVIPELIEKLIQQQKGAEVLYIVSGGIGDSGDHFHYQQIIINSLNQARKKNQWTPTLVGPNGLGLINSPLELNSLFIPKEKLQINFDSKSKMVLISQSGAFLITRMSKYQNLCFKYAFSIGNQLDLGAIDIIHHIQNDKSIETIALYLEGLSQEEACELAKVITSLKKENRNLIIYKGGRTGAGQKAAAGHTGSFSGEYQTQKVLLKKAGAYIAETFNQFNSLIKWSYATGNKFSKLNNIAIVTNAGFESVSSADLLEKKLGPFSHTAKTNLSEILNKYHLDQLVHPQNPLDLTPMASEQAYIEIIQTLLYDDSIDAVLVGIVPLSQKLKTHQEDEIYDFAYAINAIAKQTKKPIAIVIDAGLNYHLFLEIFEKVGLPVFDSIDHAALGINIS